MFSLLFFIAAASAVFHDTNNKYNNSNSIVDGEYIVVFKPNLADERRQLHMSNLLTNEAVGLMHEYSIGSFAGYAAKMDASLLDELKASGDVAYIEPNKRVYALDQPNTNEDCILHTQVKSWGLTRTNHRALPTFDGTYQARGNAGHDVTAYVIDTGIYIENEDFNGQAKWGVDTADNPPVLQDSNGHGTHVAGTIMGQQYGLAKKATAIAVKVLGTDGSGTNAGVIAGVNWVVDQHKKKAHKRSVANMSLGGGRSTALDTAVNSAVEEGVVMVVAAGNDGRIPWWADACDYSPAAATEAITVGSTNVADSRSDFSNYGPCVNIFAPGSDITSAWIGSPTAAVTISGTSMAAPHVAGAAVKYWSYHPDASSKEVEAAIYSLASPDRISDTRAGSANLMLFADCSI